VANFEKRVEIAESLLGGLATEIASRISKESAYAAEIQQRLAWVK